MAALPFLSDAALLEQGGSAVAGAEEVPCSIWPARSARNSEAGRHHTHAGEAHLDYADELRVPNRMLEVDSVRYRIVSATPNGFVPHVVLELLQTSGKA